jgi:uncharacterized protein YdhG (YjbR/CyaY superfamily)
MWMARSEAKTVDEFLAGLPEERRKVLTAIRKLIRKHLPKGYEEAVNWGMLTYQIPLARYPDTYNGQPLCYVALASQKNYCSLHVMAVYMNPVQTKALQEGFAKEGKKLNMGKGCIRFQKPEDLALDAIAKSIASTPPAALMQVYEAARAARKK